jgi:hypothetical protein
MSGFHIWDTNQPQIYPVSTQSGLNSLLIDAMKRKNLLIMSKLKLSMKCKKNPNILTIEMA